MVNISVIITPYTSLSLWEHFTNLVVSYNLRSRVLPVPRIHHVYAESLFVYQLVKILNDFDSLTIIKLRERSHSFAGFSTYVTRKFIEKYSDKKIVMPRPILLVNAINVLNTTKYNLIN